jgi:hypothetical protein
VPVTKPIKPSWILRNAFAVSVPPAINNKSVIMLFNVSGFILIRLVAMPYKASLIMVKAFAKTSQVIFNKFPIILLIGSTISPNVVPN